MSGIRRKSRPPGVRVQVVDGIVIYDKAARFTIENDGTLVVTDPDGDTVARFEVGNWLTADLIRLP